MTEIEPDDAAGAVAVGNDAPLDVELVEFLLDLGDPLEVLHQRALGLLSERPVVDLDLLQHALAVVDAAVDVQDVQALLEQRDRGQEVFALESVLVQLVGMVVRGHAADDAQVHDPAKQPPDDHRVGDVVDVHLVEADEAVALGYARRALPKGPPGP